MPITTHEYGLPFPVDETATSPETARFEIVVEIKQTNSTSNFFIIRSNFVGDRIAV
jgi:hypothetical protein